jgi:hypothetical protein
VKTPPQFRKKFADRVFTPYMGRRKFKPARFESSGAG